MDKVGINAPSGNVIHFKSVERAAELFRERGWDVTIGEDVYTSFGRFGGSSDSARLNDFQQACSDNELVLCARGGYGFSRLLPNLDFNKIKIRLKQAFLLLMTGHQLEYALEIDVMLDGVFPKQTFIDVERLSLMVWNTKRSKILSAMNIVDVDKLLEDTE